MMREPLCLLGMLLCAASQVHADDSAPDFESAVKPQGKPTKGNFEDDNGNRLAWGVQVVLLRLAAVRPASEPARYREFTAGYALIPAEFGFFVALDPSTKYWRLHNDKGEELQLFSPVAMVLVSVDKDKPAHSSLSLGVGIGFLNRALTLGISFDLYRGIGVRGGDGVAGSGTAPTGLISWAISRSGEITPENIAILLSANLSELVTKITGNSQKD